MSTPPKHHSEGFLAIVQDAKTRIPEINIDEYKKMRESGEAGQLIDVREQSEYAAAHAAGAIHLSKGVIERDIEKTIPDKNAKLVLYCGGGFRSALATDNIRKMCYKNAISLDGGWRAYDASGLPVKK